MFQTDSLYVTNLPLNKIVVKGNIRDVEPSQELQELAASMQAVGQEVEIRVYPVNSNFVLKSGHRRVSAAKLLGWETIRAIVEPAPENQISLLLAQMAENESRESLSYMDKARLFSKLKDLGLSQKEIAAKCGSTDAEVSLALGALRAIPKLQKAISEGSIAPSAAEPLLSQSADVQEELVDAAIKAKTVRGVTALVKAHKTRKELGGMVAPKNDEDDDVDPLELMSSNELAEALSHLKTAQLSQITDPKLVQKARPTVEELVKTSKEILKSLGKGTISDDK